MMRRTILFASLALTLAVFAWAEPTQLRKPWSFSPARGFEARADSLTGFDVQTYTITLNINHSAQQISGNVLATVLAEQDLTSIPYNLIGLNVSAVLVNDEPAAFTHANGIVNISLNITAGQTFTTQVWPAVMSAAFAKRLPHRHDLQREHRLHYLRS